MTETTHCELCGEPMPPGEEMFKFHGYSGPCPRPPDVHGVVNTVETVNLAPTPETRAALLYADLVEFEDRGHTEAETVAWLASRLLTFTSVAQPDNGNIFTFCDYVYVRGGNEPNMPCVRGAGHNGPHAVSYRPYPQQPIMLLDH